MLRRGSGEILADEKDALLIRDRISGAYLFACDDAAVGIPLLEEHIGRDCGLLMVSGRSLGRAAFERYGFAEKIECYQVAYYGPKPSDESVLRFREADEDDLAMLIGNYHRISPEELGEAVRRRSVLLGYYRDRPVGFIGEHLEGSMGMLYVFPEYRRRGFGAALQRRLIAKTMEAGYIPFGQVETGNVASLELQKKTGMTRSDNVIVWMWR